MVLVTAGTDVYGAVRKVAKTPIVTKFSMLHFVPLFPIESYYLSRLGPLKHTGIPLIFGQTTQAIIGLRLARVDRLSVLMAYLRALGAALATVGFLGLMFAIVSSFSMRVNENDPVQRNLLPVSELILACGALIAIPTYYFTYVVPQRERSIRSNCGLMLGIAADPAHLDSATARELLRLTRDALARSGVAEPNQFIRNPALTDADQKRLLLVLVRATLATGGRRDELERLSDSLLDEITSTTSADG